MINYQKKYDALIAKAQKRIEPKGYFETHHIIPASFFINNKRGSKGWLNGNPDDPSNLVRLTALEHVTAHRYLAHIHGGLMWHAYHLLVVVNGVQLSDKKASVLREEYSKVNSKKAKEYFINNPEAGKIQGQKMKQLYIDNPNRKKIISQKRKEYYVNNPEAGKTHGQKIKQRYIDNPEIGKKHSQFLKNQYANNLEKKMKLLQQSKTYWNNPKNREIQSQTKLASHGRAIEITFEDGEVITRFGIRPTQIELGCNHILGMACGSYKGKTLGCKALAYIGRKIVSVCYISNEAVAH